MPTPKSHALLATLICGTAGAAGGFTLGLRLTTLPLARVPNFDLIYLAFLIVTLFIALSALYLAYRKRS